MTKTFGIGTDDDLKYETIDRFRILNFGHCDLFDICDLVFGISWLFTMHCHQTRLHLEYGAIPEFAHLLVRQI